MPTLKWPDFDKIRLSDIQVEIIQEYNLQDKATPNGWIHISCIQDMYSLPQGISLVHDLLEEHLNAAGYQQRKLVPWLWKHDTHPIQFMFVVNDVGIKYPSRNDANHLFNTLKQSTVSLLMMQEQNMLKIIWLWLQK